MYNQGRGGSGFYFSFSFVIYPFRGELSSLHLGRKEMDEEKLLM